MIRIIIALLLVCPLNVFLISEHNYWLLISSAGLQILAGLDFKLKER